MQDIPKQPLGPRVDAFNLHKSIGLAILALDAVPARLAAATPGAAVAGDARVAVPDRCARRIVLLYAAMIALPLAGISVRRSAAIR